MKGIIKWYSDTEGFGIIEASQGQFGFNIKDFLNGKPKEGKTVSFELANKNIVFHTQQMQLANHVRKVITIAEVIGFIITVIFGVVGFVFAFFYGALKILDSTNHNDKNNKW